MNGPTEPPGSPLGRHGPTTTEEDLVLVELRRLPVTLLLAPAARHEVVSGPGQAQARGPFCRHLIPKNIWRQTRSQPQQRSAALMDLRLHEHQADRLASLRSCQVHDSAQEETFKMLTGLTARERRAPISMIVLVDHDPQWFLSRHRAGRTGGPRSASVCSHVVAGGAAIGLQSRGRGSVLVALASNTLVGASDATPAMPRTRSGEGAGSW